jgi:hypothetical protein
MARDLEYDDPRDDSINYDEAVKRGKVIALKLRDYQLESGELADQLEPRYGEETLLQFAADIGVDYETLKTYRTTYRSWRDQPGRPASFSVARALNRHPHKYEVYQENPTMSVQDAKQTMLALREDRGADKLRKRGMSINAMHRRKTIIIRKVNEFLSPRSDVIQMIREIQQRDKTDFYYIDEIAESLKKAMDRIKAVLSDLNIILPDEAPDQLTKADYGFKEPTGES